MERILHEHPSVSIAISLPGLEASCIGYIINLTIKGSEITVYDITAKALFTLSNTAAAVELAKHLIGYEFSEHIHAKIIKLRDIH